MSLTPSFELYGVAATVKELGQIDPELAKAAKVRIREAANPMVNGARGFIPNEAPLSKWSNGGRTGWSTARVKAGITAKVSTSRSKTKEIRLLNVVQKDVAGAIFDMAGRRSNGNTLSGQNLIKVLNEGNGPASRSMWRAYKLYEQITTENLRLAVADLEELLNNRLGGD